MGWWDSISWLPNTLLGLLLVGAVYPVVLVVKACVNACRAHRAKSFAAAHGLQYAPSNDALLQRWNFAPLSTGRHRRLRFVAFGSWAGRPIVSAQFTRDGIYTDPGPKTSTLETCHVVSLQLRRALPDITLVPTATASLFEFDPSGEEIAALPSGWTFACPDQRLRPALQTWCEHAPVAHWAVLVRGTDALMLARGTPTAPRAERMAGMLTQLIAALPTAI